MLPQKLTGADAAWKMHVSNASNADFREKLARGVSSDEQAFQEFESLFVEKILNASINNDDPEEENFFESNETQLYREILHREVAKEFSKQHSIGTFKNSMELPKGYRRA